MPSLAMVFDVLAVDRASGVFQRIGGSAAATGREVEASSTRMGAAMSAFAKGSALAGAAFTVISVKMAADFQQSVTKLATTAGESTKNLKMVGQGMLDMAGQVGVGANELAKGMYIVESSGIHGADALKVLKAAAQGAKQEQADLSKVTDAVTTALHDYNLPASQAANVTSQMVAAVSTGKTTFDALTGSLHSVTPLAAALHVPFADIIGSLAAMTASGESVDQATQNMADAIRHLANPTKPMIDELAQLGITASNLSRELGTKGLSGVMQEISQAILQHMGPSGQVLLGTFNKSKIAAADAKQMFDNLPPAIQKVAKEYENGTLSLGDWRKAVKALPADQAMLATSWRTMQDNANGFTQALKSGKPGAQEYAAALAKATGDVAGLTVALQLTGDHTKTVNSNIKMIAGSTADAAGNIKGWAEVQGNLNQQLDEARHKVGAMAIEFGQHLLPVLTSAFGYVNRDVLPGVEKLGSGLGDLGKWFSQLPGPIKAVAEAMAGLALANAVGLFTKLGNGIVYARVLMLEFAGTTTGAMATVTAAYQGAAAAAGELAAVQGSAGLRSAVSGIAGLGAAAGATAKLGFGALRSGASGLITMLGGPWVVGLAAAAGAVLALKKMTDDHNAAIQRDTEAVKSWYEAMGTKGGAEAINGMNNIRSKQLELSKAQADLIKLQQQSASAPVQGRFEASSANTANNAVAAAQQHIKELSGELAKGKKEWDDYWNSLTPQGKADATVAADEATLAYNIQTTGTNSIATKNATNDYNAAKAKQKDLTDKLNAAEQTQIEKLQQIADIQLGAISSSLAAAQAQSQFADAVSQYNKDAKDGQHSTKQLKDESNSLAQQAISTAQAIGKQEHDQLTANHQTDDGTVANKLMLASLKDSAAHITGPGHDALVKAYDDLLKASAAATTMKDAATQMGLNVVKTFNDNTVIVHDATAAQIKDLQALGDKVTHLPNGDIVVTSDTHLARASLDALINDYQNKVIRIMGPTGQHVSSATGPGGTSVKGAATGGPIVGPGSGTSDTAGLWALSNGEHVWTAAETQAAGGHSGVESLRKAVLARGRGRANGGAVLNLYDTIPADLSAQAVAQLRAQIAAMVPVFTGGGAGSPEVRAIGRQIAAQMGYAGQFSAIDYIFSHESGWNPLARNPSSTAFGIPQFLASTWAAYGGETPYAGQQIHRGIQYMVDRYGSPNAAAAFWQGHHWYKDGTNFVPSDQLAVLHRGEAVVPASKNQGAPYQSGGSATFHLYDSDGVLLGTMRGIAQQEAGDTLMMAANRGSWNG